MESYTFDIGAAVGKEFLTLVELIDSNLASQCSERLGAEELSDIFSEIAKRSVYKRSLPCIEGILSQILRSYEFETPLMTIWSVDDLWENQKKWAPICEIPGESGFVQFAFWTGEADGDGWVIDTGYGEISSLDVGSGESDLDQVRLACYARFSSPWQWISYLRCVAWERGWIPKLT